MRSRITFSLAALLVLTTVSAANAVEARLPEPIVAHVRVASPRKSLQALDSILDISIKRTPLANRIPPGIISVGFSTVSPLPVAAWNYNADVHFLFLAKAEGRLSVAAVVESEGLDVISSSLPGKGESTMIEDRGRKTLVARLNRSSPLYCFQELPGERVLIAENADWADAFQDVLRDWTPVLDSGRAIVCQIDLANIQSIFGPRIRQGFAAIRGATARARKQMEGWQETRPELVDPADFELLQTFCEDSLDVADRLVTEAEVLLPTLEGLRFEFDAADDRLFLSAALTGAKDSRIERDIARLADAPNPGFPFADAFPAHSFSYYYQDYYQAADSIEPGAALSDFAKEIVNQLLARTSPESAAEIVDIFDAAARAGLRATGGGAYTTAAGNVVAPVYTAWDRPDDVLPLVRRTSAFVSLLNDKGMELINKYIRKAAERRERAERNTEEKAKTPEMELRETLGREGLEPIIVPEFASDDGESYGVPYASLIVDLNFEQFFPVFGVMGREPGFLMLLARIQDIEENLRYLWVRWKDAVVFSHGVLDPDNLEGEIADIIDAIPEGGDAFAGMIRNDGNVETIAHRQIAFSMVRPSQALARLLIDIVRKALANDEDAQIKAWEVFHGMEENNTFVYSWSGVEDDGMRVSLLIPAESVNNMVKNGFRQQANLFPLMMKIGAAMRRAQGM